VPVHACKTHSLSLTHIQSCTHVWTLTPAFLHAFQFLLKIPFSDYLSTGSNIPFFFLLLFICAYKAWVISLKYTLDVFFSFTQWSSDFHLPKVLNLFCSISAATIQGQGRDPTVLTGPLQLPLDWSSCLPITKLWYILELCFQNNLPNSHPLHIVIFPPIILYKTALSSTAPQVFHGKHPTRCLRLPCFHVFS
jgi:hypothetical protein